MALAFLLLLAASRTLRLGLATALYLPDLVPSVEARPLTWFTPDPSVERIEFGPSQRDWSGPLYTPRGNGPHSAILLVLGITPAGPEDPRVVSMADGLARMGFVVLVPYDEDLLTGRLRPEASEFIVAAHGALADLERVDASAIGIMGFCVGASLSAIASADPRIASDVRMLGWFGGYFKLSDLVVQVASRSYVDADDNTVRWSPDPLARRMVAQHLTELGVDADAERIVEELRDRPSRDRATTLVNALPSSADRWMSALSPADHADGIRAPVYLMRDDDDRLVPPVHTEQMADALGGRVAAFRTFSAFTHVDFSQLQASRKVIADIWRLYRHVFAMVRTVG